MTDIVDIDDDDDQVFEITVQVPVSGALDTIEVRSTLSWMRFRIKVANQMEIPESELNVAYKLSVDPKSDLPRCLSTAKHYLQMLSLASQHVLGKVKSRSKKPFSILIIDKTPKDVAKKGKGPKGFKGTKVSTCHKTSWAA